MPDTVLKYFYRDHLISFPQLFEARTTVIPFCRGGKTETERLSNLLKVTQPIRHEAWIQTQTESFSSHAPDHTASQTNAQSDFKDPKSQAF